MNMGSRLWTISEEMSISMLTKPKTQTPEGICRNVEFESLGATVTFLKVKGSSSHQKGKVSIISSKYSQAIEHDQQARPHISEHGHPHGRAIEQGKQQEHRLDAQSQDNVLPENGLCLA